MITFTTFSVEPPNKKVGNDYTSQSGSTIKKSASFFQIEDELKRMDLQTTFWTFLYDSHSKLLLS